MLNEARKRTKLNRKVLIRKRPPVHPLLYQRVPVKTPADWDRPGVGNLQLDCMLHCGRTTAGKYLLTLSATDIATGWREGSPQKGRSQKATQKSLERIRQRVPLRVQEVHPDNDSEILNDLLWNRRHRIRMSPLAAARPAGTPPLREGYGGAGEADRGVGDGG